ncbi:hypothetical protein NDN08_006880 [Rhodosorus marinus]|uniref:N-acetyltransferase domain-containing protein n=1 Tax=Rhodosorus marinus TaxID=101924 RepID=A0AAV8UM17_9RHOD|nr:hypothetical protein NDN08_006880 [Rhodosorus marinus]
MSCPAFVSVSSVVGKRSILNRHDVRRNRKFHAKGRARVLTVLCAESCPRIRPATEDDIELLVDIYSDAFLGDGESLGLLKKPWFAWKKLEVRKQMSEMFDFISLDEKERLHMVYIAELDSTGQAAGFVQLMTMPCPIPPDRRPAPELPYIGNLSVFHKCRRRGVASALVTHCEDVAISKGFSEIFLHVELGNLPASEMYSKLEYRAELVDPEYYSARGKTRRVYLRKVLVDDEEEDELESTEYSSASVLFNPNERVEPNIVPETA